MLNVSHVASLSDGRLPKIPSDGFGPRSGNEFHVTTRDHRELRNILSQTRANPYGDYSQFRLNVRALIEGPQFPSAVRDMCHEIKGSRMRNERLHFLIRNLPVDLNVPSFNSQSEKDSLQTKYAVKKTFIGEAVLEMFSQLTGTPLLAYSTRNNGDFFQDVIAEQKYQGTQTQKTDGELYPHNDRTAHDVRPDILNLLAMRKTGGNIIPTSYFDGRALLANLSPVEIEALQEAIFFTPFDDFSKASNPGQQRSEPHAVLSYADNDRRAPMFRFYSGRTDALAGTHEHVATRALLKLERALKSAQKYQVNLEQGDLLSIPNLRGLHSREVIDVVNPQARAQRWLLKTYAFWNESSRNGFAHRFDTRASGRVID